MRLTQLNIRYDPDYPFDWVNQQPPEVGAPLPKFPFDGHKVSVLGLHFVHKHIVTEGFDPYAGDRWTLELGKDKYRPWLLFTLDSTVSWCAKLEVKPWRLVDSLYWHVPWGWWKISDGAFRWFPGIDYSRYEGSTKMPRWFVLLWDFLEYRRGWWECNSPQEDYRHMGYWE